MQHVQLKKSLLKLITKDTDVKNASEVIGTTVCLILSQNSRRAFKKILSHFTGSLNSALFHAYGTRGSAKIYIGESYVNVLVYDDAGVTVKEEKLQ